MINKLSVSFIVPCYNENENIVNTVNEILSSINELNIKFYEIIIIDDASTDDTFFKSESIKKKNPNVLLIKNIHNLGYGGTVKKGFKIAKNLTLRFLYKNPQGKIIRDVGYDDVLYVNGNNGFMEKVLEHPLEKIFIPCRHW